MSNPTNLTSTRVPPPQVTVCVARLGIPTDDGRLIVAPGPTLRSDRNGVGWVPVLADGERVGRVDRLTRSSDGGQLHARAQVPAWLAVDLIDGTKVLTPDIFGGRWHEWDASGWVLTGGEIGGLSVSDADGWAWKHADAVLAR